MKNIFVYFVIVSFFVCCNACSSERCEFLGNQNQLDRDTIQGLLNYTDLQNHLIEHLEQERECQAEEDERAEKQIANLYNIYSASIYNRAIRMVTGQEPFPYEIFNSNAKGRIVELAHTMNADFFMEYNIFGHANGVDFNVTRNNGTVYTGKYYAMAAELDQANSDGTIVLFRWTNHYHNVRGNINGNHTMDEEPLINLTHTGSFRFDCDGKILSWHIHVPYLELARIYGGTYPQAPEVLAKRVCDMHELNCGNYRQYANYSDCME